MKRTDRRSDCPTNFAVQAFGDGWSLLIVRDLMFSGKRTFSAFAASEERIATNVLSSRLRHLTEQGIIRKEGSGRDSRYSLTAKGIDLVPVMVDMIVWSGKYDPATAAPATFLTAAAKDRAGLIQGIAARLRAEHLGAVPQG